MRFLPALALIAGLAAPVAAAPDPGADILPFPATETTLANGLRVIVVPTGFPNIVSVQIPVLTGSRNEVEPGKSGFAHFFEHMMFRGTANWSPDAYSAEITRAGARQNAFTTDDFTNYHTTFAKEDLETVLKLEADRFQHLEYSVEAFKTESRAVLGEYNKNSANPTQKIFELMRKNAFTTHTYRHTTMGFLEDIENMPNEFEYSKTFFRRWYRPENTALIVAGDVDPAVVLPMVERYWGAWKPGAGEATPVPAEPPAQGPVYGHVEWPTPTAPWVVVAFHGPAFAEDNPTHPAMDLFMNIHFGSTSDLYRRLVEQEQKVDQMFAGSSSNVDPGLITIFARLKKPEDAVGVRDEILRTVARARGGLVDARRLAEAKDNLYYGLTASLDNTESIASTTARFVRYRRSFATLNNVFRLYRGLTPEDLAKASARFLTDANLVITTLSHQPLAAGIGQIPALASLAGAPAGLNPASFIIQKNALPQLHMRLLFDVGSAYDPPGKEGLARLAASMIGGAGSREMRIDEIKKALYPIAGGVGAIVDKEMTTFSMSVHRDNWDRFAATALPMLLDPGFRTEDFERLKAQQKNSLLLDLRSNNEEELAKEWLQARSFAGTGYGHPVLGSAAGLEAITLDDVRAFVRRHYTTGNLKVGIHGDVPDAVAASLAERLGRLPAEGTPRAAGILAAPVAGREVDIIQKDTRATAISFGHPITVRRNSPDFAALNVARAWLGEHRSSMSRLYDRIREKRGMNYGDYAYIEAFPRGMFQFFPDPNIVRQQQLFEVWIRPVAPEHAHMALRIALDEVERLVEKGLSQAEFDATRNYLMKNVYVMTANQAQQIGYALDADWYAMGEYARTMRAALARLTRADVNRAVRRHLRPADLRIVCIAKDAEALKQALVSDAVSLMKYDAEKPADLLEEDRRIGAAKLGIRSERVRIVPVDEVFAR